MVMMVGGDAAVLEQVMPVLESISRKVVHMGAGGQRPGNQGGQPDHVCRDQPGGDRGAGVRPASGPRHGQGGRRGQQRGRRQLVCRAPWPHHDRGTFEPGFRVALHHKDLKICQAMLAADDVQLPMVEMTLVHYERLMADGHGDEDISALYRVKRPLFGEDA